MHGEPLKLQRGARTTPPTATGWVIGLVFLIYLSSLVTATGRIAFIDHSMNSSLVLTQTTFNFSIKSFRIAFSFLTCNEGQLLYQRGNSGDYIKLYLQNNIFYFSWKSGVTNVVLNVANNLDKNTWYFLDIFEHTGDIKLHLQKGGLSIADVIIANNTYRASIFRINLSGSIGLQIGGTDFTGCVMQGPYVLFLNNPNIVADHILWNDTDCPLISTDCKASQDIDNCWTMPCINGGTCNNLVNAYNCTCPHMFNGTICENNYSGYGCSVLACLNGGTCLSENDGSRNYRCLCIDGFTGINCEISINECASSPCRNGKCIDRVNNYTCDCTGTGYTGPTCNDDINECNTGTSVCGPGTCYNHEGSFSCQCPQGFDGHQCQNDINECNSSPCVNGATCSDGVASYTCTCVTGFDGDKCQHDKDDCLGVNCTEPNTECVDGTNSHRCECKAGFTGSITSCTDINECSSDLCKNGATCENLENKYNCVCRPGFNGTHCEFDINECSTTSCKNGASCEDLVNSYQCTCAPGFTGSDCDTDIDECVLNSEHCINGATCVNLVNDYSCNCSSGWTGRHCEQDIDDCSPNPCQNGGACHNYINYYNCTCMPGYEGKNCDVNIDDCSPNPCQHGSSCIDLVNGYNCSCSDEWMGKNCTDVYDACSFAPCKNGATCSTTKPLKDYSCACVSGFSGHDCGTNIDDCKPDSCVDPFVCHDLVNNYTCACPTGFTGINCSEEINACNPSPCLNGGTCTEQINGNYTCQCQQTFVNLTEFGNGQKLEYLTGYTGRNCEIDIDECSLTPSICLNEGTCQTETGGDYVCQCGPDQKGYYTAGKYCELRISYCDAADRVKKDPPACKNGGTCISGDTDFSCICAPGFTGGRCKTDIDECLSDPCQYNGNCTDQVNGYICDCIPGITGANCETDIDECQSTPCQYNGNCTDKLNGYTCDCIPGITGDNCETDINECASTPCNQGGQCNDKINGYECNCTDTGFNGTECQYNIDDCALLQQPCRNNASCTDLIKDYHCNCFVGYDGKDCEVDIDECISNPCRYNGTCTQRSIQSRPDFSYFTAAGYDCSCIPGITGVDCKIDIDECINNTCQFGSTCDDQINYYTCICAPGYHGDKCEIEINECDEYLPCKNGASCQDKIADYDCMCPEFYNSKQYGGKNCTVELTLCVNNTCMNGATCRPYLISETPVVQQAYECVCQHGFTGVHCEIPTTMSFDNISFIKHNLAKLTNNTISIRFRTTLSSGILFAWDGNFVTSTLFCTIELWNGMLYVTYPYGAGNDAVSKQYHFPYLLNDSYWHEVKLIQTSMLTFELKSSKCSANCSLFVSYTDGAPKNTTWFGKPQNEFKTSKTVSKSNWIGCMEDIHINSAVLTMNLLNSQKTNSVNVESGCLRQEQCFPNSCKRRGTCLDLWNKYKCVCDRPFHGTNCDEEFTPATFAEGDSTSWTSFNITGLQDTLKRTVDVSFLFRTREAAGLIMFLGNQGTTYITLELYQGYILSRVVLCSYKQAFFINETLFNDGEQHLTQLRMKDNTFTLSIDTFSVSGSISSTDCDLNANNLYFGGKIPISFNAGRRKRSTDFTISVEDISDLSTVGKYKGTIQDIELNTRKLLFYAESGVPSILATNVSSLKKGEISDNTCSYLPCENNGTCSNVFFNDFNCSCPHGFIGKNCSALDFCKDQSCPTGAECNTLSDGFECISTATFSGKKDAPSVLSYSNHISSDHQINEIMFKLRTIVRNGHIMLIKSVNGHYIIIEIKGGNILVTCSLDNKVVQQITVDLFVSNKSWYTVYLKQVDRNLELTVSGNDNAISNTSTILLTNDAISLQTLINYGTSTTTIELGFTSSISPSAHHYYSGCLREVRMGGILLPFYRQSDFQNFTTDQYFSVSAIMNVQEGCNGGSGCFYNQCKHSTFCLPDYYGYQCNCTGSGYYGDWCQTNIDSCEANVCNHGQCVDKVGDFYCRCQNGYSGNRCETSADVCNSDPCQNNGSCQQENGGFKCDCSSTAFVGQICNVSESSICSQTLCKNGGTCQNLTNVLPSFSCTCQDGFTGYTCDTPIDYCTDLPCENDGNCTSTATGYKCDCPTGFFGKNCTDNVNDCDGSCQNGGLCIDIINGFICNCTDNWKGPHCDMNVDECERQPCVRGTCQDTIGSFSCLCDNTGYEGQYCDKDIDECQTAPCQNNGICFNFDGGYNCSCSNGYEGKNCETPNCSLVNCENGANCAIDNNYNKWQCNCVKYYFGQFCELKGPCADNPCNISNTEDCTQEDKDNGSYNCYCKTGWEGVHCDDDINECNLQFCQNILTCTNTPGDYTCTCLPGYTDKNCSTDIDECAKKPCQNNAVCTDKVNDFDCDCNNTGYTNKTCSDDIDECAQDDKCINKIRCENTPGDYNCICEPGYIGKTCTVKDPDYQKLNDDIDIMWYIIGPVVAVILIAIVVVIIVFVMCARSKRATRGTYSPSRQEVTGSRVELGQVLKPPPEERLI